MGMNWCVRLSLGIFTTKVYSQWLNIRILCLPSQLHTHLFFFFLTIILLPFLSKKKIYLCEIICLGFSFLSHPNHIFLQLILLLSPKIKFILQMQQANIYAVESDIDYLFQSCASLGFWRYSTNQAAQLLKIFTVCTF